MSKCKVKKLESPQAGNTHLSAGDHVQMLVAERNVSVAKANLERDSAQADLLKLQAKLQLQAIEQKMNDSYGKHEQAKALHRKLSDDVAVRYALDWQQTCFEPATGELRTLPPEP